MISEENISLSWLKLVIERIWVLFEVIDFSLFFVIRFDILIVYNLMFLDWVSLFFLVVFLGFLDILLVMIMLIFGILGWFCWENILWSDFIFCK